MSYSSDGFETHARYGGEKAIPDSKAPHQSEVYLLPRGGCYRTVTGYTLPELDSKVNAAVKEGWKPVSMHVHSFKSHPKVIFYMAMVRGL